MNLNEKKIALVANTSWSIYNFRLEVARHFQSKGYTIFVIAPRDKHSEKLIAEGFHFIDAPVKSYSNNPIHDLRYFFFLAKQYREHRFDHIFHYTIKCNIYGSLAAKYIGLDSTAVITGMGRLPKENHLFKNAIIWKLYKLGCQSANNVWFLNEDDQKYFLDKRIVGRTKSQILPSEGVNLKKYKTRAKKEWHPVSFLFAGRLLIDKGVDLFISAAEQVKKYYPNTEFDIVGFIDPRDDNSISPAKILMSQSKGIITFHGDTEDIRPFIQETSCVVLPSFYGEGISRILLESGAMSTPMITSANRGCADVVIDGYNGFVCKDSTIQSLVDQMLSFISLDTEAKEVMSQNGLRLVSSKFDVNKVIHLYDEVLEELSHSKFTTVS